MKLYQYKSMLMGLAVVVLLTGCASLESVSRKMLANKQEGIIYGTAKVDQSVQGKDLCEVINNQDPRCANIDEYLIASVWSKFGFADGAVGINAFIKKDHPQIEKLKAVKMVNAGDKNDKVFVKAKVTPGQLGEILEIISVDGDGKCYWSGLPRAGGTVCRGLYDYRKDFKGVIYR